MYMFYIPWSLYYDFNQKAKFLLTYFTPTYITEKDCVVLQNKLLLLNKVVCKLLRLTKI